MWIQLSVIALVSNRRGMLLGTTKQVTQNRPLIYSDLELKKTTRCPSHSVSSPFLMRCGERCCVDCARSKSTHKNTFVRLLWRVRFNLQTGRHRFYFLLHENAVFFLSENIRTPNDDTTPTASVHNVSGTSQRVSNFIHISLKRKGDA